MLNRVTIATLLAILAGLFAASTATAAVPTDRAPIPPPTDYWKDQGFILMAHQGGEWDFPPNTMYAYKQAIALGADMIDMDAYVTEDGKIVLPHDLDPYKNSNAAGPGLPSNDPVRIAAQINNQTLAELKQLDFAYKWSPHDGSAVTPFRGVATGDVPPPTGFTAADFRIPTFDEVLAAFPDTPINIEFKQVSGVSIQATATEAAAVLASHPGHDENVVINSFGQEMLDAIHAARPEHKSFGGSQNATLGYIQGTPITPTPVALEPPDLFNFGTLVRTVPILKPWADHDGYQIYVWGSDDDPAQDTDPFYAQLIAEGADSYNTPSPTTLAAYLCSAGIAKPDGTPRCPGQVCPEGKTGIAPDNCVDIPVCPEATEGTPPDCVPILAPVSTVSKVILAPAKASIKAGKKKKLSLKLTASAGSAGSATVKIKSSNRRVTSPKSIKVQLKPGGTVTRSITVKASKKAKGKAKISASSGGKSDTSTLAVKKRP